MGIIEVLNVFYHPRFIKVWSCDAGHEWSANVSSIRNGIWCPQCTKLKRLNEGKIRNRISIQKIKKKFLFCKDFQKQ